MVAPGALRILVAIPHYFAAADGRYGSLRGDPGARAAAVLRCLAWLQQSLTGATLTSGPDVRVAATTPHHLDVVLVTRPDRHLVKHLEVFSPMFRHEVVDVEPTTLHFACHRLLAAHVDEYDYLCLMEDDEILRDPLFFFKLRWFDAMFGPEAVLQAARYEVSVGTKAYIDGPLPIAFTAPFQDARVEPELHAEALGMSITFHRSSNPHSSCFFLTSRQLRLWMGEPHFGEPEDAFVGPLESGATLGIMRRFRLYKAAPPHVDFLEIEHSGSAYLDDWHPDRVARRVSGLEAPAVNALARGRNRLELEVTALREQLTAERSRNADLAERYAAHASCPGPGLPLYRRLRAWFSR